MVNDLCVTFFFLRRISVLVIPPETSHAKFFLTLVHCCAKFQVKSVRLKAGPNTHDGCGIDGELLHVKGQVCCSLLPQQCQLIGRPAKNPVQ